ncbi:MAG: hypothetical protein EOP00_25215 [Pedobacter sp.]|nr:MAG: hypothetical protein EOP00_25215 [Pedobacter sp.]
MKKVIAIVAIFVLSILGLSSYNTNEVKKNRNESNSTLLASLNNGGTGAGTGNPINNPIGNGGNKKD